MAEELPQDLPLDTGAASLLEDDIVLHNPNFLPAKPDAINPYFDVVGNSLSGSDPVLHSREGGDPFMSIIEKAKAEPVPENPYYSMKPFTYSGDDDNNLFERYHSSGDTYDKLGFSPYRNNEALYNKNMTLGNEFVRAAKQWDDLVGVGFMSGIRSWETLFTDPLSPDIQGAKDMKHIMDVGSSGKGGIGGFFINTFLNSGYTVGVGMDFLGEELALMGATAVTGGAGGSAVVGKGISTIAKLFSRSEKIKPGAQGIHAAEEFINAEKSVNNLGGVNAMGNSFPEARNFWTKVGKGAKTTATGIADILNPLDNTVAALKATDYATNYARTVKTFGAFADDLLMMKGAVSEAKLEGGMVKIDANQNLIDEFRNDKIKNPEGKLPEGDDLKNIEKIANDEAHRTAFWNLPAIITSNKLMYATMLAPLRRIMGREVQELIPAIVLENKAFREVGEGIADRAKVAAKSLRKPKIYGQFGMNYLKANVAEGVQENLQEAISAGAIEHTMALYKDPIRASYEGYMPHFMKGLKEQLSAQGAETFAGGFVMGMFAQPVMGTISTSISTILNKTVNSEQVQALKEARKKELHGYDELDEKGNVTRHVMGTLDYLNDMVKDEKGNVNLDYFAPDLLNAVRTGRLANDFYSAARIGDKNGALNSRGALENNHLMTAIKTGKLDTILERLKDYKNLTKDEAAEAFSKYGITGEEDVAKALGQIDGVIERAKKVKETYEDSVNKYPNPINPKDFKKDPDKYNAAVITKQAWDDAVYQLVFAKATFEDYSKRVADMTNTFSQISTALAQENSQSVMALLGVQSTMDEINMLHKEISVLDEKDPEQNKRKKDKTAKLEKIQKFYDDISNIKLAKSEDAKIAAHEKAKQSFGDYIQYLAKKKGNLVFNDTIESAYTMIKDHLLLKDDMAGLSRSINVLMTPKSFLAIQEKMQRAYSSIFSKEMLSDVLATNAERFGFLKDIKDVIADITASTTQPSLLVPTELSGDTADAYNNGTDWPKVTHFIDASDGATKVKEGKSFDIALEKWNTFIALQKQPKLETEDDKLKTEDDRQALYEYNNYDQSLRDNLTGIYNSAKASGKIKDDVTLATFLHTDKDALMEILIDKGRKKAAQDEAKNFTTKNEGIPLGTKVNDESRAYLNTMGYSNTQIDKLSRKEREQILKEGIVPEDFFKTAPITTPTSDIEAKKADIERRREEAIEGAGLARTGSTGKYVGYYQREDGSDTSVYKNDLEELKAYLNTKYDAELTSLEVPNTESKRLDLEEKLKLVDQQLKNADTDYSSGRINDNDVKRIETALERKRGQILDALAALGYPGGVVTEDEVFNIDTVEPIKDINSAYKGKIIYITPGSGKTKTAKDNEDIIDADQLLLETIQEIQPDFPISESMSAGQNIYEAIRYGGVDKTKLYNITRNKIKEMAAKGKTILTSSIEFMKNADYVMIQTNSDFILDKYDQMKEINELNKLDNINTIGLTQDVSTAIKIAPAELIGLVEKIPIDETVTVTDPSIEDINQNLTVNNLEIAQDKGYDAIYENNRYAITKVDENSVTLKAMDNTTLEIKPEEITAVTKAEDVVTTTEENKDFKNSQQTTDTGIFDIDFDADNLDDAANDITKKIC